MKVFIKGLNSCGMRKADVQRYRDFLAENEHEIVNRPQDAEVLLLWTCAFRRDFRDNSISEIKRYTKEFDGELIVCGCLPDIDRDILKKNFSGRFVSWRNDQKGMEEYFGAPNKKLSEINRTLSEKSLCNDVEKYRKDNPLKDASFIDRFNKLFVTEGCNFECSYCSERLAFPPYRSFPEEDLVKACRDMVEQTGKLEVMLLGDSIGDYGCDTGSNLPALIHKLKGIDPELKVALQGLNPASIIRFYNEMKEFLLHGDIRHLQIPIQSASDRILKLMNRPYTRDDLDNVFGLLRSVNFTEFDTHLIIGFPGEKEEDLEQTLEFVLNYRPKYVLASGYMESPAMQASGLKDKVNDQVKYRRLRYAESQIKAAGILCNTDDSELSADRCRRLNLTYIPIMD